MIGPTEPDIANKAPKAIGVKRAMIADPATASSPNCAIDAVTNELANGVAIWVMIAGPPMAKNGCSTARTLVALGIAKSRWTRTRPNRPMLTMNTRASTVATAAPRSSSPKPKIISGSNSNKDRAGSRVTHIALLASPSARSRPEQHIPSPNNGDDGSKIQMNCKAALATSPLAPISANIGRSKGKTSKASALIVINTIAKAALALRRAKSRLPCPSAREVSAPAAIDSPMLTEPTKNNRVLAKPNAAVNSCLPSWAM